MWAPSFTRDIPLGHGSPTAEGRATVVQATVARRTPHAGRIARLASVILALTAAPAARAADADAPIMVAAAMSLRNVMPKLVDAYRAESGAGAITVSYGASGDLRRQVEGGAPIDAVVFAAASDVELLVEHGQISGGKRVVASNSLLLIGPKDAKPLTFETIDTVPAGEHIAIGDPKSVPAGRYAQQALEALNKWAAVRNRLVFGGHVAAVLQYARRGEVAAAVVYRTDVVGVDDIVVLDDANGAWAPRIETVAGVVAGNEEAAARAFLEFLETPAGRAIFTAHGFAPPAPSAP